MKYMFTKILLTVVIIFNPLLNYAQYWDSAGEMPHPVAGGQAVVIGAKIYIIGGYSDELQESTDMIQEYDPSTGYWEVIGSMSESRVGLSAVSYDNFIYYFGGIDDSSMYINSFEKFSSTDAGPGSVVFESESFNREFAASVVVDNQLYIFGGIPNQLYDSLHLPHLSVFNFDSSKIVEELDTLFQTAETPSRQMAAVFNKNIYIFGGVSNTISNKIYKFDTEDNSFVRLNYDMQLPRAGGAAVYLKTDEDEAIYLIGGSLESESAVNTVEVFDLFDATFSSRNEAGLGIARTDLMAVAYGPEIYVFGGYDASGNVVSEIEIFSPLAVVSANELITVSDFKLHQNYPNPFNPTTKIRFDLNSASRVKLEIFSSLGQKVTTLLDEFYTAGSHRVYWNGNDSFDNPVSSGIYFYRITTADNFAVKKMTLLR